MFVWRIPLTRRTVSWYGWRMMIGTLFPFEKWVPWCVKGPLWNWCWQKNFDWRRARDEDHEQRKKVL